MTVAEAKQHLLERSEDLVRHELARRVRQMEEEARTRGEAAGAEPRRRRAAARRGVARRGDDRDRSSSSRPTT